MSKIRLRQVALAAPDLETTAGILSYVLDRPVIHRDPSVGIFGLQNVLFGIGDGFLEVVSPVQPDTTVGRLLAKQGDACGYMVIFQVEDLDAARQRVAREGVRVVFDVALDQAATIHLHPKDIGGGVVSIDRMSDWDAWAWAGEHGNVPQPGDPLALAGVVLTVGDPSSRAAQWGRIVEAPVNGSTVKLDTRTIRFEPGADAVRTIELFADRPAEVLERARTKGLPVTDNEFQLGKITFRLLGR